MPDDLRSTIRQDVAAAAGFLTTLPASRLRRDAEPPAPDFSRASRTFPFIGAFVGIVAGLLLALGNALGLPPLAAALVALAGSILLTGALHEDGLADTFDGLAGGRTVERRLEIMRDSRIGTYGVLALVVSIALRAALIAAYLPASPWRGAFALIAAETLGRMAIVWVWAKEPSARTDGLAATLGAPGPGALGVAMLATLAIGLVAGSLAAGIFAALIALAAAALATVTVADWSRRRIGGRTGDILGASEQAAALAALLALAAFH